jgi:hypothetical protein
MSSVPPIAFLVVVLVPPAVAFFLTVESSRRKLLIGLRTVEDVERTLARKPWYVSRGQLVAWEYLIAESEATGEAHPHRNLHRVGSTGRRLWIVWQGVQPTRLFHPWTSALIFAIGGIVIVRPAYAMGEYALAFAEAAAIFGLCVYLFAAGRLQRDDEDWRLGASLRPLLAADSATRIAHVREIAGASVTTESAAAIA